MDTKMYCNIMNRIRRMARENGESEKNVGVKITLVNGTDLHVQLADCELLDDFVEIWTGDEFCFVPIKNILTISC